jgi:signal transduction histidine kinase
MQSLEEQSVARRNGRSTRSRRRSSRLCSLKEINVNSIVLRTLRFPVPMPRRKSRTQASPRAKKPAAKVAVPWPAALERRTAPSLPDFAAKQIKELHDLTRKLMRARDEQQRLISRELHDNVAQVLAAAANRIELAGEEDLPAAVKRELEAVRVELEKTLDEVGALSRQLRPGRVELLGLAAALEKHAEAFRERIKLDLQVDCCPVAGDLLTGEQATNLFRIAQEALTNIEKHAEATAAALKLSHHQGEVRLEVVDNGRSFDVAQVNEAQTAGRLGLLGMRERAHMLGGTLCIEAAPGNGTTVTAVVPVPTLARPAQS